MRLEDEWRNQPHLPGGPRKAHRRTLDPVGSCWVSSSALSLLLSSSSIINSNNSNPSMCPLQAPGSSLKCYFHSVLRAVQGGPQGCGTILAFYSETTQVQRVEATCPKPRSKEETDLENPGVRPPRKGLWTRPELPLKPCRPLPVCLPPHPSPGTSVRAYWWCGLFRVTDPLCLPCCKEPPVHFLGSV